MKSTTKIYLLCLGTILLISISFIVNDYQSQLHIKKQDSLKHLLGIATTIGGEIEAVQLKQVLRNYTTKNAITQSRQDSLYYHLHTQLAKAQHFNGLKTSIHSLSKSEGNRFFYGISSAEKPYYWQPYPNYPEELLRSYDQGGVVPMHEDDNGRWIAAFYPVKDASDNTLAVIWVRRLLSEFEQEAKAELRSEMMISIGMMIALSVLLIFLLKRILDQEKAKKSTLKNELRKHQTIHKDQENSLTALTKRLTSLKEEHDNFKEQNRELNREIELHGEEVLTTIEERDKLNEQLNAVVGYAKGIQQILLPDRQLFSQVFPDSFVLFRPKDDISGDFYFCTSVDDRVFIAIVDCTGQGVPGAFLNLIAHNFFHQIIEVKKVLSPNAILDEMHLQVSKLLQQENTPNSDGMDIALCVVDRKTRVLEFAGAQRPLIYIEEDELHTVKGDSFSVGGRHRFHEEKFSKTVIDMKQGTNYYLFSDGLQDQMGFAFDVIESRKFGKKRMEQLFSEVHQKPMATQKALIWERFNDWRREEVHVDDILIVGFRID